MPAIAYFISWTCYGTRIHGDERGTIDDAHNVFGTPFLPPDETRVSGVRCEMTETPWTMTSDKRLLVHEAMIRTAAIRSWRIIQMNVRTNHVHIVVDAPGQAPEHVAAIFKTWATRALKATTRHSGRTKFWTNQASTRHLFSNKDISEAVKYVKGQ
jgi:REP element-mobilizing transposase RayT